jgi:hypothetical protein
VGSKNYQNHCGSTVYNSVVSNHQVGVVLTFSGLGCFLPGMTSAFYSSLRFSDAGEFLRQDLVFLRSLGECGMLESRHNIAL